MNEVILPPGDVLMRAESLQAAASAYDMGATPNLGHLRPHQLLTLEASLGYISNITTDELMSPYGAAILMPTGSGKTISGAAIAEALTTPDYHPKILYLVPSTIIQHRTKEDFDTFAPSVDTVVHNSNRKDNQGDVCLMTYQSLDGAIQSGFIDKFKPDILISDEAHHIIDGFWASMIEKLAVGRISFGMTATPAYTSNRNVKMLFPDVLIHRTLKQGIDDGFVSAFKSFIYRSNVKESGDPEAVTRDMLEALNLATAYAALGKIGIISCVSGNDRAHARAVESVAPMFNVGDRPLQVKAIDGTMPDREIDSIIKQLRLGELDAVAYTQLLGEGFDLPELDYLVMLAWTHSIVAAAQRLGRATRLGKITDVIEFHRPGYVSHIDAYNEEFDMDKTNDRVYLPSDALADYWADKDHLPLQRPDYQSMLRVSRTLLTQHGIAQPTTESSTVVGSGQAALSFKWKTKPQIMTDLHIAESSLDTIFAQHGFEPRAVTLNNYRREYYAPEAVKAVLDAIGALPLDDNTQVPVMHAYRKLRAEMSWIGSYSSFLQLLAKHDIEPQVFINKNEEPVLSVPIEALTVVPELPARAVRSLLSLSARRHALLQRQSRSSSAKLPTAPRLPRHENIVDPEALQERLEDFLLSLQSSDDDTPIKRSQRQARINDLQHAISFATTIPAPEIASLVEAAKRFDPESLLARNLKSMSEKLGTQPASILVALHRVSPPIISK